MRCQPLHFSPSIVTQAGLASGDTALIHAVGSGVGSAALQIARSIGARTLGTARTEEKLERARDLGMNDGAFGARLRRYPYLRELARDLRQGSERLGVVRPTPSLCDVIEGAFVGLRRSARVGVFAS